MTETLHERPQRMGRRGFLIAAVVAAQSAMVVAATQADRSRAYLRQFTGFDSLSKSAFYELVATYSESAIPLAAELVQASGQRILGFVLSSATPVFLSATVAGTEPTFVHPLIVRVDDGPRLLLPLIRSATPDRSITSAIQLGTLGDGRHTITVEQDSSSTLPLPSSLSFQLTRPQPDSLLARFYAQTPVIEIKNTANVLDDIPLISFAKIFRNDDSYKMTTFVIFSSENGGTMPAQLLDTYQRTVDIEWVTQQLYSFDAHPIPGRLSFQTVHHGFEAFAGRRVLGTHPYLSIATENNNFSDGTLRILGTELPFVRERIPQDPILYAPKPRFLPPSDWGLELLRDFPELERWSMVELALEGCVVDDGEDDPDEERFFAELAVIKNYLEVTYTSRGCQHRLRATASGGER